MHIRGFLQRAPAIFTAQYLFLLLCGMECAVTFSLHGICNEENLLRSLRECRVQTSAALGKHGCRPRRQPDTNLEDLLCEEGSEGSVRAIRARVWGGRHLQDVLQNRPGGRRHQLC